MQIRYLGKEKFEIKTKEATILLGYSVTINDFALPGPGEYEKNGVFVEGVDDTGNVIYVLRTEEMTLCHLGKISHELSEDELKEIGDVDILFVPMGEEGSLPAKKSLNMASKVDPRIVIPMLYTDLSEFKKIEGISDGEIEILKIKKADLPEDERQNIILKAALL